MLSIRKVSHNYQARYTQRLKAEVPNIFFFETKKISVSTPERRASKRTDCTEQSLIYQLRIVVTNYHTAYEIQRLHLAH